MKGISRRTRTCAALAATGVVALAGASMAQAQTRPASVGDGVPTGQGGVQLFNYGGWLGTAGGQGTNPPAEFVGLTQSCLVDQNPAAGNDNDTRQTPACRTERLEALFKFLQRKGVTNVELFGHAGFPASTDIAGLTAYRALLDKYGLHAGGWHGSMSEAGWASRVDAAKILGADFIGTGNGNADAPGGIGSLDAVLRSAEILNRLGKYSVENGVGPAYIHNHAGEFDNKFVHNGVLKTAFDITMEMTDPRYVAQELDVFWSSDAHNDVTGEQSAALINKWASRIKLLHMKDGTNVASQPSPTNSRGGDPDVFGAGEVDFRPVLTAARNKVQYYHQEEDGGTLTGAETSLTNLKGVGPNVVGTPQTVPATFTSVAAGTPADQNFRSVTVRNVGDAPLAISRIDLATLTNLTGGNATANPGRLIRLDESPGDFAVLSDTCVGNPVAPGASCAVSVGFKPTRAGVRSVSRLVLTTGADDATEQTLLVGQSTNDAIGSVGGTVGSSLALTLGTPSSFGAFLPATARTYDAQGVASVVSTAGNATLSVTDATNTAPGHLVNGTFVLPQALQVRAVNAANPNPAFQSLSETAGTPVNLLTYTNPTAGADQVTLGFRQGIGANDVLRAGAYTKTLTFTVSTTTP